MTELNQVYKCNVCGNMVEMVHAGAGQLVCCGQPMELKEEMSTAQEGVEKHVPVVEKTENGIRVTVGSVAHPMEKEHYIEWVQLIVNGKSYRQFLNSGKKPEAFFEISAKVEDIKAREYCNVHGLWANK